MTQKGKLAITNERTGEVSDVAYEISEEEWNALLAFAAAVDDLETTEFVKAGMPCKYAIHWSADGRVSNPEPPTPLAHVREFALMMRPIVLSEEHTAFERAAAVLGRRLDDETARKVIKLIRASFEQGESQAYFSIVCNDVVLNSGSGLRLWLNARVYHRDRDKQAKLAEMNSQLPDDILDAVFLNQLVDKARAAYRLRSIVGVMQRGPGSNTVIPPIHLPSGRSAG